MQKFAAVFLLIALAGFCRAGILDVPCSEKLIPEKLVGQECERDEECYGANTVCYAGKCTCPINFEEFDLDEKTKVCRPAPEKLGDSCQRDCKPPLLCRDGKCECWGGEITNGVCHVKCPAGEKLYGLSCKRQAKLNEACSEADHCIDAFTTCVRGRCRCTPGTKQIRNTCIGLCPDGNIPRGSCLRTFTNKVDFLGNRQSTDSCYPGHHCVTYGKPLIGHCCKLYCPYGSPDTTRSCDAGAPDDKKCRPLTHFCYETSQPGWKTSICCARPCREPTPLLVNGRCMAEAHLDDLCHFDEQCEGGIGMYCRKSGRTTSAGQCACRAGYFKLQERFWTCIKSCPLNQVVVENKCVASVELGAACFRDAQCGRNAKCYYGRCTCECGFQATGLLGIGVGSTCTNPQDPFGTGRIVDALSGFLGGNKGGITG